MINARLQTAIDQENSAFQECGWKGILRSITCLALSANQMVRSDLCFPPTPSSSISAANLNLSLKGWGEFLLIAIHLVTVSIIGA